MDNILQLERSKSIVSIASIERVSAHLLFVFLYSLTRSDEKYLQVYYLFGNIHIYAEGETYSYSDQAKSIEPYLSV